MNKNYQVAKELYASIGVDTEKAIEKLNDITISINCWQGDDVCGYEKTGSTLNGGGIQTTGNYPGKAGSVKELKDDLSEVLSLVGGKKKVNLHAIYLDNGGKFIDRNMIEPQHFDTWIDFAKEKGIGLDFNPTYFSHELASGDMTLASYDKARREFWIEHGIRCRKVGEYFGKELGKRCVTNFWMPDGMKDTPVDRYTPRAILKESLDTIFAAEIDQRYDKDAVESKLFGIGTESYVVGSNEFYMAYAAGNKKVMVCLDAGHFHPTEVISNKISTLGLFYDEFLLHVSRPVRWDSDHVVILDDELKEIAHELIRNDLLPKANIALDYFDASINRIAAWIIGVRSTQKALLFAMLEPTEKLKKLEQDGDYTSRLALVEEYKTLPFGVVYDEFCNRCGVPSGADWLNEVKNYEKTVLSNR